MKVCFFNIFIFLCLIILSNCSESDIYYKHKSSDNNLYFVLSTFRHGARHTFFGTDYFGNRVPAKGALTAVGAQQHLEIGKNYRERYSNFLNMSFDPKQMYIRSSDVERTVVSTLKELEGLFGRVIGRNYLHIIKNGIDFWNLYYLNNTDRQQLDGYFNYCDKKKRRLGNMSEVLPLLKECYGVKNAPDDWTLCDSVFTAYYEYKYANKTDNRIGKCGSDKADKLHDFCVRTYNSYRGWNEKAAYMFYKFFENVFRYMTNAIEGKNEIKMVMIGGHDTTVDKLMNFFDGLHIINRTHYPHYACNIVLELRKYNDDFYLEIYYNDILKYNQTLQDFVDTLDNSKYSNMYNFCGYPPGVKQEIKTTTIETTIVKQIPTTQKIENTIKEIIHPTTQLIVETPKKVEIPTTQTIIETTKKLEIPPTIKVEIEQTTKKIELPPTTQLVQETNKKEEIPPTQKVEIKDTTKKVEIPPTTQLIIETTKKVEIPPTQKMEIKDTIKVEHITPTEKIEPTINNEKIKDTPIPIKETEKIENQETQEVKEENKETQNNLEPIVNLTDIVQTQEIIHTNSTLKMKLKKFFKQEKDLNLYIILITIVATIIAIIFFVILFIYLGKRKRKFMKLSEENTQNKSDKYDNNINILSVENRK